MAGVGRRNPCLCLAFFCLLWRIGSSSRSEDFQERLLLRPLPDGKVLAHFQFVSSLGEERNHRGHHHHKLFPKAIFQIVESLRIQEMELSFTQGRWEHRQWGVLDGRASSTGNAHVKPGGVELWAQFRRSSHHDVDMLWRNLTHALSGLFCASINFLEDPAMVGGTSGAVRQGALPREAVCTENLTPWLKLLPCRDRAGLSTLLERPRIHNGHYYSLRVHVTAGNGVDGPLGSLRLAQTLTVVLKSSDTRRPNWSLSSLFGKRVVGRCPLATSSNVQIDLEESLVEELKTRSNIGSHEEFDVNFNSIFQLNSPPQAVSKLSASLSLDYDVRDHSQRSPLDVGMSWRAFLSWSPRQGPFRATQFLTGRGNGRGAMVSVVNANPERLSGFSHEGDSVDVTTFQIVPWYVRLYMHTLKVVVDGQQVKNSKGVRLKLSPADDRKSPAVLELGVTIPLNASLVLLSVEFDKGYLRIDEHPPDANRGFDLPSALFTFSGRGLQNDSSQMHSDNLLVLLATPDFSMPYNVITFVMTALALYFGSLLNALRLRSLPEAAVSSPQPAGSLIVTKIKKLVARLTERKKLKTL